MSCLPSDLCGRGGGGHSLVVRCRYTGKEEQLFEKIMNKYSEGPAHRLRTPRLSRALQNDIKTEAAHS